MRRQTLKYLLFLLCMPLVECNLFVTEISTPQENSSVVIKGSYWQSTLLGSSNSSSISIAYLIKNGYIPNLEVIIDTSKLGFTKDSIYVGSIYTGKHRLLVKYYNQDVLDTTIVILKDGVGRNGVALNMNLPPPSNTKEFIYPLSVGNIWIYSYNYSSQTAYNQPYRERIEFIGTKTIKIVSVSQNIDTTFFIGVDSVNGVRTTVSINYLAPNPQEFTRIDTIRTSFPCSIIQTRDRISLDFAPYVPIYRFTDGGTIISSSNRDSGFEVKHEIGLIYNRGGNDGRGGTNAFSSSISLKSYKFK